MGVRLVGPSVLRCPVPCTSGPALQSFVEPQVLRWPRVPAVAGHGRGVALQVEALGQQGPLCRAGRFQVRWDAAGGARHGTVCHHALQTLRFLLLHL